MICKDQSYAVLAVIDGMYNRVRYGLIYWPSNTSYPVTSEFESLTNNADSAGPITLANKGNGAMNEPLLITYKQNSYNEMIAVLLVTPSLNSGSSMNSGQNFGTSTTFSTNAWTRSAYYGGNGTSNALGYAPSNVGIHSGYCATNSDTFWVSCTRTDSSGSQNNNVTVTAYEYTFTAYNSTLTIDDRDDSSPSLHQYPYCDDRLYGFWDSNSDKLILRWNSNSPNPRTLGTSYGTLGANNTFTWTTPVDYATAPSYGGGYNSSHYYNASNGNYYQWDRMPPIQLLNNDGIYLTTGSVGGNYGPSFAEYLTVSPQEINNESFVGFATAASSGNNVNVVLPGGTVTSPLNGVTLTTGKQHYLDMNAAKTAPTLTTTQTSTGKAVGVALSSSVLLVQ